MSMDKNLLGLKRLKKKTIKSIALAVIFLSLILVVYQLVLVNLIEECSKKSVFEHDTLKVEKFLNPQSETGGFICHSTGVMISLSKLNDDYCDCPDGSDEPQTDACPNSEFQCHHRHHLVRIPSGRVNDGICDCCDGSDEWKRELGPIKLSVEVQKKIGIFLRPCPNTCSK